MSLHAPSIPELVLSLATLAMGFEVARLRRSERRNRERFRRLQNAAHFLAEAAEPPAIAARARDAVAAIGEIERFELYFFDERERVREVWTAHAGSRAQAMDDHPRIGSPAEASRLLSLALVETPRSLVPLHLASGVGSRRKFSLPLFSGRDPVGHWEVEFAAPLSPGHAADLATIYRSVTEAVAIERNFRLAARDGLSGLYVRRYFDARVSEELARCSRRAAPCSVAQFDLDHFKALNDTHGHPAGDEAIRTFARLLSLSVRAGDVCGRRGGEEFAALFPELDAPTTARICERLRSELSARPLRLGGVSVPVSVSVGVAQARPGESAEELLARADRALYRAKQEGRDRVCTDAGGAAP